jgi:FkbM family methyltransferase
MIRFIQRSLKRLIPLKKVAPSTFSIRGVDLRFAVIDGDSGDQIRFGFEPEVYDFIEELAIDSVFYDLGASIGHFSLYAAARGLRTYAFEPDRDNFKALGSNKDANRLSNLAIFNVAISDGVSARGLLLSNSQKQRVGDHHKVLKLTDTSASQSILGHLDNQAAVETWSLDQAVGIKGLPVPNYMKVDIDGSEVAFLRGAKALLANPLLKGFIIELSKDSPQYEGISKALRELEFVPTQEYQIYSSIGLEPNLFNVKYMRS